MRGVKAPTFLISFTYEFTLEKPSSLPDCNKMLSVVQQKGDQEGFVQGGAANLGIADHRAKPIQTQVKSTMLIYKIYFYLWQLIARLEQFGSCPGGQQSVH